MQIIVGHSMSQANQAELTSEQQNQYKALLWASRRGMLELDVILTPYIKQHFATMSAEQAGHLKAYLLEDDPSLYAWLMGFEQPKPEFSDLTTTIRSFIEQQLG